MLWRVLGASLAMVMLAGCGPDPSQAPLFHPSTPAEAAALTEFSAHVKPVLQQNCYRCHFGLNHEGGFNLSTRALLLKGGKSGVDVVPGDADASRLVMAVRRQGGEHPKPMPPKDALSDEEIAVIVAWVKDGAVMDR